MRTIRTVKRFKKDLKKAYKNPRHDTDKLFEVINLLVEQGELPEQYLPHTLSGNWHSMNECHIQPDFLLIYYVTDDEVSLHACGSHSELF